MLIFTLVKVIVFIMAVMVLALNGMPCMDDACIMTNGKVETKVSKSSIPKEHNNSDNCSPFCTCNCCTGFTFLFARCKVNLPFFLTEKQFAYHLPAKVSNIALPVWQPPKLS
jgi:hypothetical protein